MNNVIAFAREEGILAARKTIAMVETQKNIFRNLLQKKFNVILSDEINQKIETAEIETLDLWIENIFDAKSIDDLLR